MKTIEKASQALPSLEKAHALLAQARSASEVKKIRIVAQAVATAERGKQIAIDAGEIILLADARIGELTREIPKAPPAPGPGRGRKNEVRAADSVLRKRNALEAEGLSKQQVSCCERIAALKDSGDLDALVAAERKAGRAPSVRTALEVARLPADRRPQVIAKLADKVDVRQALDEAKREAKQALAAKIRAEPPPAPTGPYRVIVSDPPWRYDARVADHTHRGRVDYPDMSVEEICALPVRDLAHEDCVLWLWTTNAFMRQAYQCLDAWGFAEKTILTWAKDRMGLGNWLRNQTEHCLLAVRGKPVVTLSSQTTILKAPVREHSRKPDEFYALVEALCPGNKLEMFSRTPRDGWAGWGAEAEKFTRAAS